MILFSAFLEHITAIGILRNYYREILDLEFADCLGHKFRKCDNLGFENGFCNQCGSAETALYVWGERPAARPVEWLPRNCKG